MISKTSRQPKGLYWEIKMHPVLPWQRSTAWGSPLPISIFKQASKQKLLVFQEKILLVKPVAERHGFQGDGSARH